MNAGRDDDMTSAIEAVLVPLNLYALGHATGDPSHFREAFLPTAHIEGMRDGQFTSWDLSTYCGRFEGVPAVNEEQCVRTVDHLQVQSSVATATMTLDHGSAVFTDMFVLVLGPRGWRIANKVYHRHS
jgi:Putative lumazine-binding